MIVDADTDFTGLYKCGTVGGEKKDEIVLTTHSPNDRTGMWINLPKYGSREVEVRNEYDV